MLDRRKLDKALRSPGRCRGVAVPLALDIGSEFMWTNRHTVLWDHVVFDLYGTVLADGLIQDSVVEVRKAVAAILRKYTNYTGFGIQMQTQYIRGADLHRNAFLSRVEDAVGVNVSDLLKNRSVDMVVRNRVRAGLSLVKSLDRFTVYKITEAILKGVKSGEGSNLAELLHAAKKVTSSRAKLIARDQMGKLFSNLAQARQEDIGVTRYRWSTARDSRVRDRHAAREGKEYYWKRPPAGGHPGEDINCRCVAEPVLASSKIVRELLAA